MSRLPRPAAPGYTALAVAAVTDAVRAERDFAGWLALVLATVAAELGSGALTAGRPDSWEAALVDQLVKGTVGPDDEFLASYRHGGRRS